MEQDQHTIGSSPFPRPSADAQPQQTKVQRGSPSADAQPKQTKVQRGSPSADALSYRQPTLFLRFHPLTSVIGCGRIRLNRSHPLNQHAGWGQIPPESRSPSHLHCRVTPNIPKNAPPPLSSLKQGDTEYRLNRSHPLTSIAGWLRIPSESFPPSQRTGRVERPSNVNH